MTKQEQSVFVVKFEKLLNTYDELLKKQVDLEETRDSLLLEINVIKAEIESHKTIARNARKHVCEIHRILKLLNYPIEENERFMQIFKYYKPYSGDAFNY